MKGTVSTTASLLMLSLSFSVSCFYTLIVDDFIHNPVSYRAPLFLNRTSTLSLCACSLLLAKIRKGQWHLVRIWHYVRYYRTLLFHRVLIITTCTSFYVTEVQLQWFNQVEVLIFSCNNEHWSCDMAVQIPSFPLCFREEERIPKSKGWMLVESVCIWKVFSKA